MDADTLIAVLTATVLSYSGIYWRITKLESRLTEHICNGKKG